MDRKVDTKACLMCILSSQGRGRECSERNTTGLHEERRIDQFKTLTLKASFRSSELCGKSCFTFFWSQIVWPSVCSVLGERGVEGTEVVPDYVLWYPWGSLVRKGGGRPFDEGWRVWCASENPINLPLEYLATIIIPLNWKVSVAIKGLEAGLKWLLEDPPKNLGNFVANDVCPGFCYIQDANRAWRLRGKKRGPFIYILSMNPWKENAKKQYVVARHRDSWIAAFSRVVANNLISVARRGETWLLMGRGISKFLHLQRQELPFLLIDVQEKVQFRHREGSYQRVKLTDILAGVHRWTIVMETSTAFGSWKLVVYLSRTEHKGICGHWLKPVRCLLYTHSLWWVLIVALELLNQI